MSSDSAQYHPQFNSSEADTVLASLEGTLYRVPSFVLRATSGFWNSLLSLPSDPVSSTCSPIPTSQNDAILEPMLRLMSGLPIPFWSQRECDSDESNEKYFVEIEALLTLAESWDAPGPLSILRFGITSPMFLDQPLRLYAIATHFEWHPEAKLASKHSLGLDLYDDEHEEALNRLSSKHLLALLRLHRNRRNALKVFLDDPEVFSLGNADNSRCNCNGDIDNSAWRELKARIIREMDQNSRGSFVGSWEMEEWKESVRCWKAKCGKCNSPLYHKGQTIRKMKDGLKALPDTI